jgi:adenine/guanine/hypoxanthine permease
VLTFFGFMHSEAIGIGRTPMVALSYCIVAGVLYGCARYAAVAPRPLAEPAGHEPAAIA